MLSTEPHAAEEVHVVRDEALGLEAVIVLHSTVRGPAAGGCRLWHYDTFQAASVDACRLAESMSYKNALAGLPFGGGKAVIRRPSDGFDRREIFKTFGRAVKDLQGRYVTAEDAGTTLEDMGVVRQKTRHVAGLPVAWERLGGDSGPWTARGILLSMKVAVERSLARPLKDCTVAIQGVGDVGASLAHMLHEEGAQLIIADTNSQSVASVVAKTGAETCSVERILLVKADVVAPCALGGIIDRNVACAMKARVVCGAADNQLACPEVGDQLAAAGILYAPDYVVNAGGIIDAAAKYLDWEARDAPQRVEATGERLRAVLDFSASEGVPSHRGADALARAKIAATPRVDLAA